jgi:type IV pilus assembly protein PilY1
MKNYFFKSWFVAALLAFHFSAMAEDIDLFVGASASATNLPNVMIILDNAANFSSSAAGNPCIIDGVATALSGKVGGIEQCALHKVMSEIEVPVVDGVEKPTVNIGMMVYNANNIRDVNNANCGGTVGGCLAQPLIPLTTANKNAFLAWVKSWKITGGAGDGYIKANSAATGAAMQETWAYFAGRTGLSGRSYAGIKPVTGCLKNYIVFVGNSYASAGGPGDAAGPESTLKGTNSTANMNASPAATASQKVVISSIPNLYCPTKSTPVNFSLGNPHENNGYYADEWARYMLGQNITTYTIGVLGSSCNAGYAALLTSMAAYGEGKFYPTFDTGELVKAFKQILSEIQSVDSVFASVSLPVSVNTQGTFLNQVYIGMFRPDKDAYPRWHGNLKQYKLGYVGGVLQLLDADNNSAISSGDSGFIAECARSNWTTADSYWTLNSKESCGGSPAASNAPDGNLVEKGGQGQRLRSASATTRTIKTCDATCGALVDFNNTTVTKAKLGAENEAERDAIINWARGLNNKGDETFVLATAMRPFAHGDVVHSRPVAINHGTAAELKVVVYYGGNDGMLRAVNGEREGGDIIGSANPGEELWAFVAPEFYSKIKRLRDNTSQISFKGSTIAGALPKDYGVDGPVTAYKEGSTAWIFATMRRGGSAVYAFDVTNPASPSLKWKKDASSLTGLGQTWSSPKVLNAAGYGAGASPMLIMGGGYDNCHDADPNTGCSSSSAGTKIYVLDANSGTLLKAFDTDSSVVADLTVIPDADGRIKYAYAADLGGNIYRISGVDANTPIGTTAPGSWTITKVAALGGSGADNRKFMFAPDVLDDNGTYVLLLGSGDREKPLASYTLAAAVANHFFAIKDKPADASWLTSENSTCSANVICMGSLFAITASSTPTQTELATKPKGWYLALISTEQVVTSAITVFGTVTFSTHQPTPPEGGECTSHGTANVYNINYTNAAPPVGETVRGFVITGGGLPPSPVAGMVTLDNGKTVPFIIGANPKSGLQGGAPPAPPAVVRPRSRVYWNIKK